MPGARPAAIQRQAHDMDKNGAVRWDEQMSEKWEETEKNRELGYASLRFLRDRELHDAPREAIVSSSTWKVRLRQPELRHCRGADPGAVQDG